MKSRIKDIDPGIPSGVKKWAEKQIDLLETLRRDINVPKLSKHAEFDTFKIQMWTSEDQDFLRIKGCDDRRGFLLTKTQVGDYVAHYDDGLNEIIDPIDGTPRPNPDPAKRTKFYVLPDQLRGSPSANTNAGKFTGLMRSAVGCYQIRSTSKPLGYEHVPFGYAHARTHGITKIGAKYWIVEISADGVFMAPIKNLGCCGSSWSVTKYQPTDQEIADNPTLEEHRTLLSLNWAFSVSRPGVVQVIDAAGMDGVYAPGSPVPWYLDCGWAFSASGREAQTVLQKEELLPSQHYLMTRWKLAFSAVAGVPSAVLTAEETDVPAAILAWNKLWFPTGTGTWQRANTVGSVAPPFDVQDAPLHVYYEGETAIITRWQYSVATVASSESGCGEPPNNLPGESNNCFYQYPTTTMELCQQPGPPTLVGHTTFGGTRTITFGHISEIAGFVSSKFSNVLEKRVFAQQINIFDATFVGTFPNTRSVTLSSYFLRPECYFQYSPPLGCPNHPGPVLQTIGLKLVWSDANIWRQGIQENFLNIRDNPNTAFVLFDAEREAIFNTNRLDRRTETDTLNLTANTNVVASYNIFPVSSSLSVNNPCDKDLADNSPYTPYIQPATPASVTYGLTSFSSSDEVEAFGVAHVDTGIVTAEVPITFVVTGTPSSPVITPEPPSVPAAAFFSDDVEVSSDVLAMHGNLYYKGTGIGPALSPEAGNAAYLLQADTIVTPGGFEGVNGDDEVLAFVGKI